MSPPAAQPATRAPCRAEPRSEPRSSPRSSRRSSPSRRPSARERARAVGAPCVVRALRGPGDRLLAHRGRSDRQASWTCCRPSSVPVEPQYGALSLGAPECCAHRVPDVGAVTCRAQMPVPHPADAAPTAWRPRRFKERVAVARESAEPGNERLTAWIVCPEISKRPEQDRVWLEQVELLEVPEGTFARPDGVLSEDVVDEGGAVVRILIGVSRDGAQQLLECWNDERVACIGATTPRPGHDFGGGRPKAELHGVDFGEHIGIWATACPRQESNLRTRFA